MSTPLPPHPSVEQLKKQAKDLLEACRSGSAEALDRLRQAVPRLADADGADSVALRDAQLAVARGHGFATWAKLKSHIEAQATSPALSPEAAVALVYERTEEAARVVRSAMGDAAILGALLVSLGPEACGELMKYLSDREIENAVAAMDTSGDLAVEDQARALGDFAAALESGEPLAPPPKPQRGDLIRDALERAVGPRKARDIMERQGVHSAVEVEAAPPRLTPAHLELRQQLEGKLAAAPTADMSLEDLCDALVGLAEVAGAEGILALEAIVRDAADVEVLLHRGLTLAIDGMDPTTLGELLEAQADTLVHQYRSRCAVIVAAVRAIQAGEHPRIVEDKLQALSGPPT